MRDARHAGCNPDPFVMPVLPRARKAVSTVLLFVAVAAVCVPAPGRPLPSLSAKDLASGRYARMHMLLEKTFLQIDVLRIDMRFGHRTRDRLAALARGHSYSAELADRIVRAAVRADHAVVRMEVEHHVSFHRWLKGVRENLKSAYDAGLIDHQMYRHAYRGLPRWFRPVEKRGYDDGDLIWYRVRPGSLRTVVVNKSGSVLIDRTDRGHEPPRAMLAGYFAPASEFRKPLVRSLFQK